jgi:hypothetical protein
MAALLGVATAALSAIYGYFKNSIRVGRMRGHTIVCGAGQRGRADSSGQRNRGWRGEDVIWGGIVEAFSRT